MMDGEQDVVVVAGVRTPFVKAWTDLGEVHPVELGRLVAREAVERAGIDPGRIAEIVVGNIGGPADAPNIGRVIALEAKIPRHVPAYTVNRNCASGIQAIVDAAYRIRCGDGDLALAIAVESMSRIPFLFSDEAHDRWVRAGRARGGIARAAAFAGLRPRHFAPVPALKQGLTDPVSGLNMGETAELLAREFAIGREPQDEFALRSHRLAAAAWTEGRMAEEVVPVPIAPGYRRAVGRDNGIRENQSMEALARLRPVFDRRHGTVTAGNASQITDGAVALVLASQSRAVADRLPILGRIRSWAFAGCDPARMGLGPVLATPIALRRAGGLTLERFDRIEINEAFAAQVLACERAFAEPSFLGRAGLPSVGRLDMVRVNVNGGAIALGHPVGASGARLVLTLLREMERNDLGLGLATLCVGGGQGAAIVLERS